MFGFGLPELLIVGAILVVVFGVGKLPELGTSLGKSITNFKNAANGKDVVEINSKNDCRDQKV